MAESLLSLNYSGLPTRLKSNYVTRIIDVVFPVLSSNVYVTSIIDKIRAELENIKMATTRGKSSSYTKVILEMDKKRDKVYAGVLHLIKSKKLLSEDPLIIRSSDMLLNVFKKLGKNVPNLSYSRENVLLLALFKEFEGAEAASAINTLGIKAEVELLKKSQKDFEEIVAKKVDELSALDGKKSIDSHRNLSFQFSALMDHIRYNIVEEVSPYTELTFGLNQIIGEANLAAGRPDSFNDSEDEPTENETVAG